MNGARRLRDCSGRMTWHTHGVYFFYDATEQRTNSGTGSRVVRVGTHALTATSKATLWKRLATHAGTKSSGGGNHRASIFRLLVGESLSCRDGRTVPTWGYGNTATAAGRHFGVDRKDVLVAELPLESAVSVLIGDLPFVYLPTEGAAASMRAYVERNAIALLSNYERPAIDPPSASWLGLKCARDRVRRSGLWNNNHVDEAHEPEFLDVLEREIRRVT